MKKKTLQFFYCDYFIATYTILCFALQVQRCIRDYNLDRILGSNYLYGIVQSSCILVVASIVGVLPMIVGKRE